jgi:antitoxin ParD1/3/4
MTTMTLSLPDSVREFVEAQIVQGGFRDINADFLALVAEDRQRREFDEAVLPLLQEAIESGPATPMTRDDWDEIRREVREKLAKPRG